MSNGVSGSQPLLNLVRDQKNGKPAGIFSICSAHLNVLEASIQVAIEHDRPLLIESTCNQVNQDGGYTNQTPIQFAAAIRKLATRVGLSTDRLILGGDHLGPYPWRKLKSSIAMSKARQLVGAYIQAGYTKIHLDASMPCADDGRIQPLEPALIAARTADLCQAGEAAYHLGPISQNAPLYVIGAEVPPPGGIQHTESDPHVTSPEDCLQTIELSRQEFHRHGLDEAWERVIAIVVQPGVEFGDQIVFPYNPSRASKLSKLIERFNNLIYETHSTDYQTSLALKRLVEDHFAILKVGPALTFAFREAVFALSWIEKEWLGSRGDLQLSNLPVVLERVMLAEPGDWENYYRGDRSTIRQALKYSYSDRCRYYWNHPEVKAALIRLYENLNTSTIPPTLISEFLPNQFRQLREGALANQPHALIHNKIAEALLPYVHACDWN
jgi:D-tagatose-1,6-bisphosphate aldolase subunit GatZ/KbaZ